MDNNRQHIVFITPGFPENEEDSTTIPALQDYLIALKEALPNTRMTVITFQFPFTSKKYKWNGYQVIPLNGKNKTSRKMIIWNKTIKHLKDLHYKYPISVLHSFWLGECAFITSRFANRNNIKHLITAMGQDVLKPNHFINPLLKIENAKVITLSKKQQAILAENFNIQSEIIPWGIPSRAISENKEKHIDVLGVGSLNEVKNYKDFIIIVSEIIKTLPNLKVEIIGEGEKEEEIKIQINKLGLEKNISLLGKLTREVVLQKMEDSKVLLHTSTFESFGMIFIEARQAGMQIVTYHVGIAQESGFCKIGNTNQELVELLLEELRATKKINCEMNFTIENTVQLYKKLYND